MYVTIEQAVQMCECARSAAHENAPKLSFTHPTKVARQKLFILTRLAPYASNCNLGLCNFACPQCVTLTSQPMPFHNAYKVTFQAWLCMMNMCVSV